MTRTMTERMTPMTPRLLRALLASFALLAASAADHAEGWKRVLGWLESYLEKGETVDQHSGA